MKFADISKTIAKSRERRIMWRNDRTVYPYVDFRFRPPSEHRKLITAFFSNF